jgi:hypothetical protein
VVDESLVLTVDKPKGFLEHSANRGKSTSQAPGIPEPGHDPSQRDPQQPVPDVGFNTKTGPNDYLRDARAGNLPAAGLVSGSSLFARF